MRQGPQLNPPRTAGRETMRSMVEGRRCRAPPPPRPRRPPSPAGWGGSPFLPLERLLPRVDVVLEDVEAFPGGLDRVHARRGGVGRHLRKLERRNVARAVGEDGPG